MSIRGGVERGKEGEYMEEWREGQKVGTLPLNC